MPGPRMSGFLNSTHDMVPLEDMDTSDSDHSNMGDEPADDEWVQSVRMPKKKSSKINGNRSGSNSPDSGATQPHTLHLMLTKNLETLLPMKCECRHLNKMKKTSLKGSHCTLATPRGSQMCQDLNRETNGEHQLFRLFLRLLLIDPKF